MGIIDFILLPFVCCVIVAALIWRRHALARVIAILILFAVSSFAIVSLAAFAPRWAASLHERQGKKWSEDFRDGVDAATAVASPHYPYLLVSSLGLSIIALLRQKRPNHDT